jgi:hypothetical protein
MSIVASAAARAKVWGGVSSAVGEAAAAAAAGGGATSVVSAKMLVLGTLLGGAVTVGIGAAVVFAHGAPSGPNGRTGLSALAALTGSPAPAPAQEVAPVAWVPASDRDDRSGEPLDLRRVLRARVVEVAPGAAPIDQPPKTTTAAAITNDTPGRARAGRSPHGGSHDDALAHEASIVAAARASLAKGDPLTALQLIRSLRPLRDRQLVPEELAVEAQALRALGLTDDAIAVDTTLRVTFPDSVLER